MSAYARAIAQSPPQNASEMTWGTPSGGTLAMLNAGPAD
jgi:hypothetical protein